MKAALCKVKGFGLAVLSSMLKASCASGIVRQSKSATCQHRTGERGSLPPTEYSRSTRDRTPLRPPVQEPSTRRAGARQEDPARAAIVESWVCGSRIVATFGAAGAQLSRRNRTRESRSTPEPGASGAAHDRTGMGRSTYDRTHDRNRCPHRARSARSARPRRAPRRRGAPDPRHRPRVRAGALPAGRRGALRGGHVPGVSAARPRRTRATRDAPERLRLPRRVGDRVRHVCLELEAGDSGLRSFCSVQGSLAMFAIHRWGSEEQKERWLPQMAAGRAIGCFGLTEPDAGSNPAGMRTTARRNGGDWMLNGAKMWITNGDDRRRRRRLGADRGRARSTASSSRRGCRASRRP